MNSMKWRQDLQKSNDEIISSKEYTDNIVNSMNDSLIVASQDGTIKRVNKATILLLGYTEEELIGKHIGSIIINGDKLLLDKTDTDKKNIDQEFRNIIHFKRQKRNKHYFFLFYHV